MTGLLTNEEQQNVISQEIRSCALKCVLELIKIDVSEIWINREVQIIVVNLLIDDEAESSKCYFSIFHRIFSQTSESID